MDEAEWTSGQNLARMVEHLQRLGLTASRRMLLYACVSCRRIRHLFIDSRFQEAVEIAEKHADGHATQEECNAIGSVVTSLAGDWGMGSGSLRLAGAARFAGIATAWVTRKGEQSDAAFMARKAEVEHAQEEEMKNPARAAWAVDVITNGSVWYADVLRDIFGNPFRSLPPIPPSLLTPRLLTLAESAYRDRIMPQGTLDPKKLLALAAALHEAGCRDEAVLGHLHDPNAVHVRGCHVIDALTGRE